MKTAIWRHNSVLRIENNANHEKSLEGKKTCTLSRKNTAILQYKQLDIVLIHLFKLTN